MNACNRILIVVLAVCFGFCTESLGQPKPAKPPSNKPALDDAMFRLLEDDRVRADLRVDGTQEVVLEVMRADYAKRRKELGHKVAFAKPSEKQSLEEQARKNKETFYHDVVKSLRQEQLQRLGQIKLQAIGTRIAFLPQFKAILKLTAEQDKKFLSELVRYEDAVYAEYRKLPFDTTEVAARERLMTVHKLEHAKLDRTIRENILDTNQVKRVHEAMGTPVLFEVDLVRPDALLQDMTQRGNRLVMRYREPYPLDVLIRQNALRDLLQTTEVEDDRLTRAADAWEKKQDEFYASLQYLNPRLIGPKLAEWQKSYTDGMPQFEAQLREILGGERFDRLKEIRRQICGPEMLVQLEPIKGQELTAVQRRKIDKTRTEMFGELQKQSSALVQQGAIDKLTPLHETFAKATTQLVLNTLTAVQRESWQRLTGPAIDESVRQSLRKKLTDAVHHYPARRG